MPRARTTAEREGILQRLLETSKRRFIRHGLQKTTISDLASDAGIGKGSFYQFFASKELLFMAVKEKEEQSFRNALLQQLEGADSGHEAVVILLCCTANQMDEHPFMRLLFDPTLLRALTQRLPEQTLKANEDDDRMFFYSILRAWKRRGWIRPAVKPRTVFDVLTAMFGISLNNQLLGEVQMKRASEEIAKAMAVQWCDK